MGHGGSKQGQGNGTCAEELWSRIGEIGSEIDLKPRLLQDENGQARSLFGESLVVQFYSSPMRKIE